MLLATTSGCSKYYECSEKSDASDGCRCRPVPKAMATPAGCEHTYDCCIEYEFGSFMVDDSSQGSGCTCWMLKAGETCEAATKSFALPNMSILSRPKTCPP